MGFYLGCAGARGTGWLRGWLTVGSADMGDSETPPGGEWPFEAAWAGEADRGHGREEGVWAYEHPSDVWERLRLRAGGAEGAEHSLPTSVAGLGCAPLLSRCSVGFGWFRLVSVWLCLPGALPAEYSTHAPSNAGLNQNFFALQRRDGRAGRVRRLCASWR
eukprot:SAG31_NODE_2616_length_5371_cov_3.965668_2_plen_161_part_00